jgi:hypothetical protein
MNLKLQLMPVLFFILTFTGCDVDDEHVTDIDGNVYQTVAIDTLVWMAESLKTTRYNDGTVIQYVTDPDEWNALIVYLGGETVAGSKLKDTVMQWESPYEDATNEVGFTALPGGYRVQNGYFYNPGFSGMWWTAEQFYSSSAL